MQFICSAIQYNMLDAEQPGAEELAGTMAAVNHLLLEIVPTVGHLHPQAINESRGAAGQLFARCMQPQHARLAIKVRILALATSLPLLGASLLIWRHSFKWPTIWAATLSQHTCEPCSRTSGAAKRG